MCTITVLVVSPHAEDHAFVRRTLPDPDWNVISVQTSDQAAAAAGRRDVAVVISEKRLAQGAWNDVWDALRTSAAPPMLIVTATDADNLLWGEVLNLGGYDVLAKPLDAQEVERVVRSAARRWQAEWAPAPS